MADEVEYRSIGSGSLVFEFGENGLCVKSEGLGDRLIHDPVFKECVLRALKADFDEVKECPDCGAQLDSSVLIQSASEKLGA